MNRVYQADNGGGEVHHGAVILSSSFQPLWPCGDPTKSFKPQSAPIMSPMNLRYPAPRMPPTDALTAYCATQSDPSALCHRTTGWTAAEALPSQPPRRATLSSGAVTRRVPRFYRRLRLRAWPIARRRRRRDRPSPLFQWTALRDRPLLRWRLQLRRERRLQRRSSVQAQRRVPPPCPRSSLAGRSTARTGTPSSVHRSIVFFAQR